MASAEIKAHTLIFIADSKVARRDDEPHGPISRGSSDFRGDCR
jgi:hypothetical protein